jgi:hypothetical protein
MPTPRQPEPAAQSLLERWKAFSMPGGDQAGLLAKGVRVTERGQIRSSPAAPWIPFTAEQTIDATRSGFCWTARLKSGPMRLVVATDAYEEGHGRLVVKLGGLIPVVNAHGPEADKGEIQRYLGSIIQCPSALLHHPSLEWSSVGPRTLRVRDLRDDTGATVDLEFADDGRPLGCHADRPRMVGKRTIVTPWSAISAEPRDWCGLRIPSRLEVVWHLPEGDFTYFRNELTSFEILPAKAC